jgi:phosphatidate phosphatase APP1
MSIMYPEKVIAILVKEFIGMTEHERNHDLSSETRVKLGEILVKTTRMLGISLIFNFN